MSGINDSFFEADWPAPARVRTLLTTRIGGAGKEPYSSFNLATHVGDDLLHVEKNRERLSKKIDNRLHGGIRWLSQVHGTKIIDLSDGDWQSLERRKPLSLPCADGLRSHQPNQICAILTADCLPVLMCNKQGTEVAAIHAGWQGLAKGILSEAINSFSGNAQDVLCYLGPAISSKYYEVGEDVLHSFQLAEKNRPYAHRVKSHFKPCASNKKYMADLYGLARSELNGAGCMSIYGGDLCTYDDANRFFSYRRDGITGRMASLIWIQSFS